jgi:hypothetical protein
MRARATGSSTAVARQGEAGRCSRRRYRGPSSAPYPAGRVGSTLVPAITDHMERNMAKSLDKKKETKKKPEKSLKEKRAAKKDKKAGA